MLFTDTYWCVLGIKTFIGMINTKFKLVATSAEKEKDIADWVIKASAASIIFNFNLLKRSEAKICMSILNYFIYFFWCWNCLLIQKIVWKRASLGVTPCVLRNSFAIPGILGLILIPSLPGVTWPYIDGSLWKGVRNRPYQSSHIISWFHAQLESCQGLITPK